MYCTLEDLKKALPEQLLLQLADDEREGVFATNPPNAAYLRIQKAIADADALIDGYVSGRYTLPFSAVPALICNISTSLSICALYERNHEMVLPEAIAIRRKSNIKTLEGLQNGTITLPGLKKDLPGTYIVNKTETDREFPDWMLGMY